MSHYFREGFALDFSLLNDNSGNMFQFHSRVSVTAAPVVFLAIAIRFQKTSFSRHADELQYANERLSKKFHFLISFLRLSPDGIRTSTCRSLSRWLLVTFGLTPSFSSGTFLTKAVRRRTRSSKTTSTDSTDSFPCRKVSKSLTYPATTTSVARAGINSGRRVSVTVFVSVTVCL